MKQEKFDDLIDEMAKLIVGAGVKASIWRDEMAGYNDVCHIADDLRIRLDWLLEKD